MLTADHIVKQIEDEQKALYENNTKHELFNQCGWKIYFLDELYYYFNSLDECYESDILILEYINSNQDFNISQLIHLLLKQDDTHNSENFYELMINHIINKTEEDD